MEFPGKKKGGAASKPASLENTLKAAEQALYMQDYDNAIQQYELALAMDPKDTKIMDTLGEIYLELQEFERARDMLNRSIMEKPDEGASKYMNMGQIMAGSEALRAYTKGVEILRKDLRSKANRSAHKLQGVKSKLIAALCAIAELYMTDLCDEDDAEQRCDQVLTEALQHDKTNYEALQLLASFRISQQNNPAAVEALRTSYNLWKDLEPQDAMMPSFEFRVATSKLLLELQQWDWAQELLQSLLEEEDGVAEVWYLLSFAFINGGDPHGALETANMSRRLLEKAGITEPAILSQVDSVIERATEEAKNVPAPEDEMVDDEADAEGDNDDDDGMEVDN